MSGVVLSTIAPERVRWLWPGRIPYGKLTIIDGDSGLGKSALTLDIAARLTTGRPLPDGTPLERAGVLLMAVEDDLADTVVPRLRAMGADLARVIALPVVLDEAGERLPLIPDDINLIENLVENHEVRILFIDPIFSYISGEYNLSRDSQVRRALNPLSAMAARTGCAVVMLRHLNKMAGGSSLYRGGESVAFLALCRAAHAVGKHPDDPSRRVFAVNKVNIAAPRPSLTYRIQPMDDGSCVVLWEGESNLTADQILAVPQTDDEKSALDEARDWLREVLAGGATLTTQIQRESRDAGMAWATVRRAKDVLRVVSEKARTQEGKWVWRLPSEGAHEGAQGEGAQGDGTPILSALSTLSTFNPPRVNGEDIQGRFSEDAQHAQGAQDLGSMDLSTFNGKRPVGVTEVVLATATGMAACPRCGGGFFAVEGSPALCSGCKGQLGLLGRRA